MSDKENQGPEEIYSKVLRAGRRTYFFDVRSTKADDYYLTITESKKHTKPNGEFFYKKHKIYLYKEDFDRFKEFLAETTDYIINQRGPEVISERHEPNFEKNENEEQEDYREEADAKKEHQPGKTSAYTDVSFDDI